MDIFSDKVMAAIFIIVILVTSTVIDAIKRKIRQISSKLDGKSLSDKIDDAIKLVEACRRDTKTLIKQHEKKFDVEDLERSNLKIKELLIKIDTNIVNLLNELK